MMNPNDRDTVRALLNDLELFNDSRPATGTQGWDALIAHREGQFRSTLASLRSLLGLQDEVRPEHVGAAGSSAYPDHPEDANHQCEACIGYFLSIHMMILPCSHWYCVDCFILLFKFAVESTGSFPPRCCGQEIPVPLGGHPLSPDLLARYTTMKEGIDAPVPVYCAKPTCSLVVPASRIHNDVATCLTCGFKTCTKCKSGAHNGQCSGDPDAKLLQRLAQDKGWAQCYKCSRLVELAAGCTHMGKLHPICSGAHMGAYLGTCLLEYPLAVQDMDFGNLHFNSMHLWCPILLLVWPTMENMWVCPRGRASYNPSVRAGVYQPPRPTISTTTISATIG